MINDNATNLLLLNKMILEFLLCDLFEIYANVFDFIVIRVVH